MVSLGFGAARPSAVRVRIRSRSTSAGPANTPTSKRPVLVPVSADRSASVVTMKSQPGRSPPMRQVTSLGPWPPSADAITIAPPHPSSSLRPPTGIAARHPKNAVTLADGKTSGRSPARRACVVVREMCYS